MTKSKRFDHFINELKAIPFADIQNEQEIMAQVVPIAKELSQNLDWLDNKFYHNIDEKEGLSKYCLYEAPDHSLSVFLTAWNPGGKSTVHNHGTWAVLTSLNGTEEHTLWERTDDQTTPGCATLKKTKHISCVPGSAVCLGSKEIHSVENPSDDVLITMQIYGGHLQHTNRSWFDPLAGTETPYNSLA